MKKRVVIGLSGGVDSSVAAYLLKKQGYDVVALFMINWKETTGTLSGSCPWEEDIIVAELVAKKLKIPFHWVDFSEQYRKKVVDYMFDEYQKGRTPNPDILCNREIKFDLFINKAKELGADYIATGHYCRHEIININNKDVHRLLAGLDKNKDQSYFLCQLSQEQLKEVLFPVGDLTKEKVRKIAAELNLPSSHKKDSQGICFIGKVSLPDFLKQKLFPKEGVIIEIPENYFAYIEYNKLLPPFENINNEKIKKLAKAYKYDMNHGKVVGKHRGAFYYTIGQNKGLNIGGRPESSFVIGIDVERNVLYTGVGKNHPGLFRYGLFIRNEEIHWLREDLKMKPGESRNYLVRIRYRQPLEKAMLYSSNEGMYIIFENPQRGITPGQYAAWYDNDELIGSGVIFE